jgi:hypothetical protein
MPPLATVVGGSLFVYYPDWADFTLETTAFAAQFNLADSGSVPLPAVPFIGTSLSCSANLAGGGTLAYGFVDFAGHAHQKLWFEGSLVIKTELSIPIPALPKVGPIHLATPFTLTGTLRAYPSDPTVDPPPKTFEYTLSGKGNVTVRLTEPVGVQRKVTSYFYQFT